MANKMEYKKKQRKEDIGNVGIFVRKYKLTLFLIVGIVVLVLLSSGEVFAKETSEPKWELVKTVINHENRPTEIIVWDAANFFYSPRYNGSFDKYTIEETYFIHKRYFKDHVGTPYESLDVDVEMRADFTKPPEILVPGENITLKATVSVTDTSGWWGWGPGIRFEYRAVGINLRNITEAIIGGSGSEPPFSTYSISPYFVVPETHSGEISIVARLWNVGAANVRWIYREQTDEETCEDYCKNQNIINSENAIWASGDYSSGCVCECKKGWTMKEQGCVPCEDICQQSDSRAHYDPNDLYSWDNNCGCSCTGKLLEYKFNECRCVTGAHDPDGDGECECKPGYEISVWGEKCDYSKSVCGDDKCEDSETPKNCPKDCGTCGDDKCEGSETKANCCTDCGCSPCQYCSNNQCKQATALILTSKSSDVGHGWVGRTKFWPQKKLIARDFENYGCRVVYKDVDGVEELAEYLADERVKAFAYFGHGTKFEPSTPNMEGRKAGDIWGEVFNNLVDKYKNQGMDNSDAKRKAALFVSGGWLDYFYNNACYSFDDPYMADKFVKPGGTYWGNKGWGFAGVPLTEYKKPNTNGGAKP
jgi:hypothetical protein